MEKQKQLKQKELSIMAEININKNDLEDIIKSYKRENDSFVFKSFTGSTDKKICTFIMNKKECKIQLFIKKKEQ